MFPASYTYVYHLWNVYNSELKKITYWEYRPSGAIPRFNSIYGQGSGPVWIQRISCTGDERSLFDCTSRLLETQTCSHFDDAGVECPGKVFNLGQSLQLAGWLLLYVHAIL